MRGRLLKFVGGIASVSLLAAGMGSVASVATGGVASAAGPVETGTYTCKAPVVGTITTVVVQFQDTGTQPATLGTGTTYAMTPKVTFGLTPRLIGLATSAGQWTFTVTAVTFHVKYTGFDSTTASVKLTGQKLVTHTGTLVAAVVEIGNKTIVVTTTTTPVTMIVHTATKTKALHTGVTWVTTGAEIPVTYAPVTLTMGTKATATVTPVGKVTLAVLTLAVPCTATKLPGAILTVEKAATPLAITTTSLPGGTVGVAYSQTVQASGGETPYTWSATTLPTGLTIAPGTGTISGTPTTAGTFTTVVTVEGATHTSKTRALPITIAPGHLTITTTTLPGGFATATYSATVHAIGGTPPYTWSATGLPTGLTITTGSGTISGTTPTTGTFHVTVTVTDHATATTTAAFTLVIGAPLTISTSSLPGGTVGTPYSETVAATGGEAPYSWTASTLPPGLNITSGSGTISGTPTKAGTYTVVVTVHGSTGRTVTATFTIGIAPAPLAITTTTLPGGFATATYSATVHAIGGTPPYTWSATGLPTGLTITTGSGTISGTTPTTGTFHVTVTVTDHATATTTAAFTLVIGAPLAITTTSLPGGTVGVAYSQTVQASGGETPYTWSATTLPTGLTIAPGTGTISGTPTVHGTFTAVVTVHGATGRTVTATFAITIAPAPLAITTTTLPGGFATATYSATVHAIGGTPPYTWSATGLPTGLTITTGSGTISGTTPTTGTFHVTVTVTDHATATTTAAFTLVIGAPLTISTSSLPGGTVGTPYSETVAATGGEAPYSWTASTLPPGLNITSGSGTISGTPTKAGTYTVVVTVHGSTGRTVTATFTIGIAKQPLGITTTSLPGGTVTTAYSATVSAVGGTTPYKWTATTLPAGLAITAKATVTGKTVKITGTPTVAGKFSVKFKVTGFTKGTAAATLSLTIATSAPPVTPTGYWMVASDGGIFAFGTATFHGSMGGQPLNKPIVGMAATPTGGGYWEVASDGGIFAFGNAQFYGSMGGQPLNAPIVGIAVTPTGGGYWMVASDGGIFAFGNAQFFGSEGGKPLNQPIVGITPTATGSGYWMVASDGGIFAFGTATFHGSEGGQPLNKPIVGMTVTPTGGGYWMVASDGGIFAFGTATFKGSMGGQPLNKPIVGMTATPTGGGYWMVASDGGIFSFGNATFLGSMGGQPLNMPIVGMASL